MVEPTAKIFRPTVPEMPKNFWKKLPFVRADITSGGYLVGESVVVADLIDDFDTGTIDTGKWATTNFLEETTDDGYAYTETAAATLRNKTDFKATTTNSEFLWEMKLEDTYQGTTDEATVTIQVHNGTATTVEIAEDLEFLQDSRKYAKHFLRLHFNYSAGTADLYLNDIAVATGIDISSLSNWYPQIQVVTVTGRVQIDIACKINTATSSPLTLIMASLDTPATNILEAIYYANDWRTTGATNTYELSANGGSNYESITWGRVHEFSNVGKDLRLKVIVTGTITGAYALNGGIGGFYELA